MSKVGRPALDKITVTKSIKLDENELLNWDSKAIHKFLQGKFENKTLLKELYDFMGKMEFIGDVSPEDEKFLELIDKEVRD